MLAGTTWHSVERCIYSRNASSPAGEKSASTGIHSASEKMLKSGLHMEAQRPELDGSSYRM